MLGSQPQQPGQGQQHGRAGQHQVAGDLGVRSGRLAGADRDQESEAEGHACQHDAEPEHHVPDRRPIRQRIAPRMAQVQQQNPVGGQRRSRHNERQARQRERQLAQVQTDEQVQASPEQDHHAGGRHDQHREQHQKVFSGFQGHCSNCCVGVAGGRRATERSHVNRSSPAVATVTAGARTSLSHGVLANAGRFVANSGRTTRGRKQKK